MHFVLKSCVHLPGLPPRYRDSVRAITPGLPLFLYNYTTHQLHGIFEVCSRPSSPSHISYHSNVFEASIN